jgi:hypothetical protein
MRVTLRGMHDGVGSTTGGQAEPRRLVAGRGTRARRDDIDDIGDSIKMLLVMRRWNKETWVKCGREVRPERICGRSLI